MSAARETAYLPGQPSTLWPFWHAGFFCWRAETWLGWLGKSAMVGPFPAEPAPPEYPSDALASVWVDRAPGPGRFWHSAFQSSRRLRRFACLLPGRAWFRIFSVVLLLFALPAAACRPASTSAPPRYRRASQRFVRPVWADVDHDCRDTRAEVLAAQCSSVTWSPSGCRVVKAVCVDVYTGVEVASDTATQTFHVDHLLPAAEAWKRGEWRLTPAERRQHVPAGSRCTRPSACRAFAAFFNDPRNLNVTRARTNERKRDRMPGAWCPEAAPVRPVVARQFRAVASAYRISLTPAEQAGLRAWDRGVCR